MSRYRYFARFDWMNPLLMAALLIEEFPVIFPE